MKTGWSRRGRVIAPLRLPNTRSHRLSFVKQGIDAFSVPSQYLVQSRVHTDFERTATDCFPARSLCTRAAPAQPQHSSRPARRPRRNQTPRKPTKCFSPELSKLSTKTLSVPLEGTLENEASPGKMMRSRLALPETRLFQKRWSTAIPIKELRVSSHDRLEPATSTRAEHDVHPSPPSLSSRRPFSGLASTVLVDPARKRRPALYERVVMENWGKEGR